MKQAKFFEVKNASKLSGAFVIASPAQATKFADHPDRVSVGFSSCGFTFTESMSPEEARSLASSLNAAAEQVEAWSTQSAEACQ